MSPSRRLIVPVALVLVLGFSVAACGGEDRATAPATHRPSSAAPAAFTGSVDAKAFVDQLLAAIDEHHTVHLKIDAGNAGIGDADVVYGRSGGTRVRVVGEYSTNNPSMFVIDRGVVYVQQDVGGKYVAIDRTDPSYGHLLTTYRDLGPHESVAGLEPGISKVERHGTTTVDGEQLLRYDVVVDPAKATGVFKAMTGSSGLSSAVTFEVYTDSANLLRRLETTMGGQRTVVQLVDWDKAVSITVPTGDQVIQHDQVVLP